MEDGDPAAALASERSRRGAEPAADRRGLADRHLRLRRRPAARGLPRPADPLRRRAEHRAAPTVTKPDGAGYTAEIVEHPRRRRATTGSARRDVCVAPDGSLFVADWYDPGVGGHRMQDVEPRPDFPRHTPGSCGRQVRSIQSRPLHRRRSDRRTAVPEHGVPLHGLDRPARHGSRRPSRRWNSCSKSPDPRTAGPGTGSADAPRSRPQLQLWATSSSHCKTRRRTFAVPRSASAGNWATKSRCWNSKPGSTSRTRRPRCGGSC